MGWRSWILELHIVARTLRRFIDLTQIPNSMAIRFQYGQPPQSNDQYFAGVEKICLPNTNTVPHHRQYVPPIAAYKTYVIFDAIIGELEDALDVEQDDRKTWQHWKRRQRRRSRPREEKKDQQKAEERNQQRHIDTSKRFS